MKYDAQVGQIRPILDQSNNILIALPANATVDVLAAGLSLYLSIQQAGKQAAIISDSSLQVSHGNLFGVGDIKNKFPEAKNGNMVLSLENVVIDDGPDKGTVPALEKLDWFPEGKNLNLVFHVLPGQRFQPSNVSVNYQGGKFDAIMVVGATSLNLLGDIYSTNPQNFEGLPIINIDNNPNNAQFGQVNLVDTQSGSVSEILGQLMPAMNLTVDEDIATNILAGIYDATANLTRNVTAETFQVVSQAMQSGGKLSQQSVQTNPVSQQSQPIMPSQPMTQQAFQQQMTQPTMVAAQPVPIQAEPVMPAFSQPAPTPSMPIPTPMMSQPTTNPASMNNGLANNPFLQAAPIFNTATKTEPSVDIPVNTMNFSAPMTQPVSVQPEPVLTQSEPETPAENFDNEVVNEDVQPAPDWLTPKVYKGSSGLE